VNAFRGAIDFLSRTQRFIVTSHETPDADAIGSECAISKALRGLGREVIVLNADPTPHKLSFLDPEKTIQFLEREDQVPADIGEYSLLMLDTNDTQNIGQIASLVLPRVREHFIIDHHEQEEDLMAGNFIRKSASSTAEILYLLLREMNVTIDREMAQALFTGIVYDTGSFIYPKTTALTFEIARDLVAKGVRPNTVYSKLYESNSISALILQARVLTTLELFFSNHVSLLTMTREMVVDSGANYEEADQLINIPLRSEDIRVSVFFKQNPAGLLRCSLRSKANINVAEIAQSFGGGGHRTAAGFKCHDTLEKSKQVVLEKLRKLFP
jgi:bifunctional oligoribonuclease and PAP phosphatase NrnA